MPISVLAPAYHVLVPREVRRVRRSFGVVLPLAAVLVLAGAIPALAHEARVTGGFEFVVGWGDEPAYTGLKNSVQVSITEADTGSPVTDLGDNLKAEVIKGSERVVLPLVADIGRGATRTAGDYRAWLMPTRPGTYTVRLIGSIRGQSLDESFTSAQNTFDEVEDVANIQFPAKDPSTGQLAIRIDREVPRLGIRTDAVETALAEADDRVHGARTLATVAMLVGVLGLLTAAGALVAARSGARSPESVKAGGPEAGGGEARAEQAGSGIL